MDRRDKKSFANRMGKQDILPATVIRKRMTIISLKEEIMQDQDALKEEDQGEHVELSLSLITPLPGSPPIESHLQAKI
jgi:hypothetical protein